jgi:hypothetical protein
LNLGLGGVLDLICNLGLGGVLHLTCRWKKNLDENFASLLLGIDKRDLLPTFEIVSYYNFFKYVALLYI